jgi:hypothetical protein
VLSFNISLAFAPSRKPFTPYYIIYIGRAPWWCSGGGVPLFVLVLCPLLSGGGCKAQAAGCLVILSPGGGCCSLFCSGGGCSGGGVLLFVLCTLSPCPLVTLSPCPPCVDHQNREPSTLHPSPPCTLIRIYHKPMQAGLGRARLP